VQLTGFGNFERASAPQDGSQPEDGQRHSDQGVDRSRIRAGKQLKQAVNNKK